MFPKGSPRCFEGRRSVDERMDSLHLSLELLSNQRRSVPEHHRNALWQSQPRICQVPSCWRNLCQRSCICPVQVRIAKKKIILCFRRVNNFFAQLLRLGYALGCRELLHHRANCRPQFIPPYCLRFRVLHFGRLLRRIEERSGDRPGN
jgi:hypothetical protein